MQKWNSRSLLLRYMGSFLVVLLLPMSILCIYFVRNLNNLLTEQTLEMKKIYFEETSEQLARLLDGIVNNAYHISQNDTFGRYRLTDQIRYGNSIVRELNSSRQICEIADDVYIYSPTLDYAYSSTSTYSRKRFIQLITQGQQTESMYHTFLESIDTRNGYAHYTDQHVYIYFSLPTYSFQSDTYLIYKLNPALITDRLIQSQNQTDQIQGIFVKDNTLLFSDGEKQEFLQNAIPILLPDSENITDFPVSSTLKNGQENYDVFIDYYPIVNFYYYRLSPQNAIVSIVTQKQSLTYLVILIVFLCGNLLCFLFTYLSYRPIKLLNIKAEAALDYLSKNDYQANLEVGNELDIIQAALHSLHSSLASFTASDGIHGRAIKQFLISSLLLGRVTDPEAVSKGLMQLGITDNTEFVLAAILYLSDSSETGQEIIIQEYLDFLEHISNKNIRIFAIAGSKPNQIDLLLTLEKDDLSLCKPFFSELQTLFTQHFQLTLTIAVGSIYPELHLVSISYIQAYQKIAGRGLKDNGRCLYHDSAFESGRFYQQIKSYFPNFRLAVRECNPIEAQSQLRQIAHAMEESNMQINEIHFLIACILEVLVSSFYNYDFEIDSNFYVHYQISNMKQISTLKSFQCFFENLEQDMINVMHSELTMKEQIQRNDKKSLSIAERIECYINENLQNQQLSITGMAHEFGVSASYLCRVFKERANITLLEYINTKRIDLAKKLLLETDLTVEAIVKEVGFINASSFIRKFSGIVGMTPGKFRESNR